MSSNRRAAQSLVRWIAVMGTCLAGVLAMPVSYDAQTSSDFLLSSTCALPPAPPGSDTWPVAATDSLGTITGASVTFSGAALLANDTGASITVVSVGPRSSGGGTVTGGDPFVFTLAAGFLGTDVLPYEIRDAAGRTAIGLIKVTAVGDTIAPAVSITAPVAGATVSGSVLVSVSATDDIGVAVVRVFDGAIQIGADLSAPPFAVNWDTRLVGNGIHTLTAVARDPAGNTTTSAGVGVAVSNVVTVTVPSVVGLTQAGAEAALAGAGLTLGATTSAYSDTVAAGRVISQSPVAGTAATPGASVAIALSLGPAPAPEPEPPSAGLVLALSFNEAGGTLAVDGSAHANNGTIAGAVRVPGRIGAALSFDGVNDLVTVPNSDSLALQTGMTLEAWVNPSQRTGWHTVMLKEGAGAFAYEMYSNNDLSRPAAYFTTSGGTLRNALGTAVLPLNAWSHLATTFDGTTMRLYVNGVQVRSVLRAGPIAVTGGALSIGGNVVWGGEFFAGLIDEVRIYNRALSAAEIAIDMNGEPLPPPPPPPANVAPAAGTDSLTTTAGTPVAFTAASLLANDSDADGDPLTVTSVAASSTGGGAIASTAAQSWTYTPAAGFSGGDSFAYTISDGRGGSATGAVNVTVSAPPPPPAPSTGLVLALRFDEAAGATVASDASGLGNNATVGEAQFVAGRFGNALSFDGVNDLVTVADSASLDLSAAMTLEAWVQPTALSGWHTVLLKEGTNAMAYEMYAGTDISRPAAYFTTSGGALRAVTGTAALPTNAWTHVAATYDGANMRLYVNGVQVRAVLRSGAIATTAGPLHIGGNEVWGGEFFKGLIDEVRIYNRALSAAEIAADMNAPLP